MVVDGNNFISHYLKSSKKFAAGKIGGNELQLLYLSLYKANPWGQQFLNEMQDVAGLYPLTTSSIDWFADTLLSKIKDADILPKWNRVIPDFEKMVFDRYCPNTFVTKLQHLEPYYFETPWTRFLENKTVLVMSPFAGSIERNFKNLSNIWCGKIQPNFKLVAIRYPAAIKIDNNPKYTDSLSIYNEYIDIIDRTEFDVGIFGTGHTGLLYALHCKEIGKAGIHLGGATQILFGIKGSRWKNIPEVSKFFNNHWTSPADDEIPIHKDRVEGGCYW